jgi:peptidyl-prolyl cis-trans isomerase B (cyclophilin B)
MSVTYWGRQNVNWKSSAWAASALVAAIFFAGCGGSETPGAASTEAAAGVPNEQLDPEHPVVRIETNLGSITIRLDAEKAPGTVRNFLNYVNEGFYHNTIFHMVVPDKMIIGGGFTTEHQLKPTRSTIRNEAHNGVKNLRGTFAMVRDRNSIDSATSQFFINLEDAPQRDYMGDSPEQYGYCVFGEVVDGLDVAERISKAPTTDLGQIAPDLAETPQTPVVISSIERVK